MNPFTLSDPAAADAFLASRDLHAHLDGFPIGTPLGIARFGQIALALGNTDLMTAALAQLDGVDGPLSRGVKMLLQAELGDYATVLAVDPQPRGCMPLDLEDAANAQAASSVAHTQSGNYGHAVAHLAVAIAMGHATGMTNRVGMMEIERERLYSLQGVARPEELQRLLLAPMSQRRRAWGRRTWAEALMSLGDHQAALRVLGHPSLDRPPDLALRAFLHLILGLPVPPLDGAAAEHPYGLLTRVARQELDVQAIHGFTGEPQRTYAALLEGALLARQDTTLPQSLRAIGVTAPQRSDQAFLHALIWLEALGHGIEHPRPQSVFEALEAAPDRLRSTQHIMPIAQQILPELTTLLSVSGYCARLDIRTAHVPLLIGSEVVIGGAHHRLPGRTGRILVCSALELPEKPLGREEMHRLRRRLAEIQAPEPVNMGTVLFLAQGLRRLAAQLRDARLTDIWDGASRRIVGMLTPDTADVLALYHNRHPAD